MHPIQSIKTFVDSAFYPTYVARGRRPWILGYQTAKRRTIAHAIDHGLFAKGATLPSGYGKRVDERAVEYPWVYSRVSSTPGVVLDAGSSLNHEFLIERAPISKGDLTICTLAPEKRCYWDRAISYVYDDLRDTRFRDAAFDVVISISTIEHIGLDNTLLYTSDGSKREADQDGYRQAVAEFRRITKPGGLCFITVPFGRRENHGWFQVFDAAMIASVVDTFRPASVELEYYGYSSDGWSLSSAAALADAGFSDPHSTNGSAADFAAGAHGVACLKLTA